MAAFLELVKTTVGSATGTNGAGAGSASTTYYFLGTPNFYKGDIATATGISIADPKTEADMPRMAVKELLLRDILKTAYATVKVGTKSYRYKIRYNASKSATVETELLQKTITTGKGNGQKIVRVGDPRRITSRE